MQAVHQVVITGADKTQATALAMEFWTSKGYTFHSSSYNCLIFRSMNYGSFGLVVSAFMGEEIEYKQCGIELTMLCQTHPRTVKWELQFNCYHLDEEDEEFNQETRNSCDEFDQFCREWMGNVGELTTGQTRTDTA